MINRLILPTTIICFFFISCSEFKNAGQFQSQFPGSAERIWIGPEYWTNPMQDWKLENGKMICTVLGRDRNVHLLTRKIDEQTGSFKMSVNAGVLKPTKSDEDWVGF